MCLTRISTFLSGCCRRPPLIRGLRKYPLPCTGYHNSKVINALINAARNGKKVTVVIELQARFDEESNIYWSRKLEEVGARVIFGIPGLKVHAKLLIIVRKEGRKSVNYACISTGNFHEGNATVYSDLFLFTADTRITSDVKRVFDFFRKFLPELYIQVYYQIAIEPAAEDVSADRQ